MPKSIFIFGFKLFLFSLPVIFILIVYIVTDPFKVLYNYETYYNPGQKANVGLNRDYVSTEMLLNNYSEYRYDSFIFGSSRSFFYPVQEWQKYINSRRCFHFNASSESLYGINAKLKFLKKNGIPVKNALIVIDRELIAVTENFKGLLFIKHPALSGQNWISFNLVFIEAFFDIDFLKEYIFYRLTGNVKKNLNQGGFLDDSPKDYNPATNEIGLAKYEIMIKKNPDDYYRSRQSSFFRRNSLLEENRPVIGRKQKILLEEIYEILIQNKSEYRIIINPMYDQIVFNRCDYVYLCELFGKQNIYDFSGVNKITNHMINYYDHSHYRPHVAKYILKNSI